MSFAIYSSFARLYFESSSEREHRSLVGTLLVFLVIVPGTLTLGLEVAGRAGWLNLFQSVPFVPYLNLTLWTAYFSVFLNLPLTVYITRQQPRRVMLLNVLNSLLVVGLSLYYVLYLRQGVVGSLTAGLVAAVIMGVLSIGLTLSLASRAFSLEKLKAALLYSLPLVPHLLSQWVLNLSDRLILAPSVSASQLGIYSLGYQLGLVMAIFTNGISSALGPIFISHLKDPDRKSDVPRLGTFAVISFWFLGLATTFLGQGAIRFLTPVAYHGATEVVPWVVLGFTFHGMYMVVSTGTFYSMRTGWIPGVTAVAAITNIGLNLWLVPIYGIMAAAVNTAIGYGVLMILHGYLAHKLYPIPWEYRQWSRVMGAALISFAIGAASNRSNIWTEMLVKSVSILAIYPFTLVLFGVFTQAELALIRRAALQLRPRVAS